MTDTLGSVGTDALAVIQQVLTQYGLQDLTNWAIQEIQNGSSADQITQDMTTTPQFQNRFPAISMRVQQGLPAISPGDYVTFENQVAQMESQFGFPQGSWANKDNVTKWISGDVSISEVQSRAQDGFQAVAYGPQSTRQAFTQMFGVGGDAALAYHFSDPKNSLPILTREAAAASIAGNAGMAGINIGTNDALKLAQMGKTGADTQSGIADLAQHAPLFQNTVTEGSQLNAGQEGIEAEFGLNSTATQEVINREQAREAAFQGGGQAYMDTHGAEGAGTAHAF